MAELYTQNLSAFIESAEEMAENLLNEMGDMPPQTFVKLRDELCDAILFDGRLSGTGTDPVIDARVSLMGTNKSISVNATNLGEHMPDSIALGIITIDKDGNTRHRYSKDRQEMERDPEIKETTQMAREISEMEQLFEDSKNRLQELGYTLDEIPGTQGRYLIMDEDLTYGELIAGIGEDGEILNVMINNTNNGEFSDISNISDINDNVDKFFAFKEANMAPPEEVTPNILMEVKSRLERIGYELNPLGDEERAYIVRYKDTNLGAFDMQPDGRIGLLTMGDYQLKQTVSNEMAFQHFQGLGVIRDEELAAKASIAEKVVEDVISDESTGYTGIESDEQATREAAIDEFVRFNQKGVYVEVGENENGEPLSFGLDAKDLKDFIEEKGIEPNIDSVAHELIQEFEANKESIIEFGKEKEGKKMDERDNYYGGATELEDKQAHIMEQFLEEYSEDSFKFFTNDGKNTIMFELNPEELRDYIETHDIKGNGFMEISDQIKESMVKEYDEKHASKDENTKNNDLNLTPDMSEKEMAEAVVNYVNDGREPDPDQQEWIDGHSDNKIMSRTESIASDLKELRDDMAQLREDISADEEKLTKLNSQLDQQLAIAKMNGCPAETLDKIGSIVNDIKDTTNELNENRAFMAGMEEKERLLLVDMDKAVRDERSEALKEAFGKVQDTLSKGVKFGLNTLDNIKDGIERHNIKAMEKRDTKEKIAEYKELAWEIEDLHRDYVNEMEELKADLEKDMQKLEKVTQKAEFRAELLGSIKDIGRLITGKERQHDYEISDKAKERQKELNDKIANTQKMMHAVDKGYENLAAKKEQQMDDLGKTLTERGKDIGGLFSDAIKDAQARAKQQAKDTHDDYKVSIEAR